MQEGQEGSEHRQALCHAGNESSMISVQTAFWQMTTEDPPLPPLGAVRWRAAQHGAGTRAISLTAYERPPVKPRSLVPNPPSAYLGTATERWRNTMAKEKPKIEVAEIERLDLRTIFPREDTSFTPWLAEKDNLDRLGRALGFDLETVATEASTGTFRTDILAKRVQDDATVVIENQYGRSDHDHFGKSLTYLAAHGASVVVWLAEGFADEHRASLSWLNDHTDEEFEFWGIIPRVLKIGDSQPGLRFDVAIAPNVLVKRARKTERKMNAAVTATRETFWGIFNELTSQDPVLSECATRYGGGTGFTWLFPTEGGGPDLGEPHVLVFISLKGPCLGYGIYCRKGADPEHMELTDAAFETALSRLQERGVDPGEVDERYAEIYGNISNEQGMRELAQQSLVHVRTCIEVLSGFSKA